ncbi:hypothetical protein ACFVT6_19810 [Streptomyces sp. NPDC058049]|uniref:hypothetical protein n=1 Tax=Streptomyces sp. NPDC058049 TaxID=3346314 RepID=UPI0036E3938C
MIAEPDQCGGRPDPLGVEAGSIGRPLERSAAFAGVEAAFPRRRPPGSGHMS